VVAAVKTEGYTGKARHTLVDWRLGTIGFADQSNETPPLLVHLDQTNDPIPRLLIIINKPGKDVEETGLTNLIALITTTSERKNGPFREG
jgi:hypothetical protein